MDTGRGLPRRSSSYFGKVLCIAPCAAFVVMACWPSSGSLAPAFTFAGGAGEAQERSQRTAMQYKKRSIALRKPFYSPDAKEFDEISSRWRQEARSGQATQVIRKPNQDKLPGMDDIYARKFSGNAAEDPIGGRKWYSLQVMYGDNPKKDLIRRHMEKFNAYLRGKLSAKNVQVATLAPGMVETEGEPALDKPAEKWTFETPMKRYGEVENRKDDSGTSAKNSPRETYTRGYLVRWDFQVPPAALPYMKKALYGEPTIVRFLLLGHTRKFSHEGEDNELFL